MTKPVETESMDQAIRVLIVDDHDVVALGLRSLIEDEPGVEVVGIAGSVEDAVAQIRRSDLDVLLVDYRLPIGTGADAIREIASAPRLPGGDDHLGR